MTTPPVPASEGASKLPPKAERIVDEAVRYIQERGLSSFQLRAFAPSIGISHRVVIHYFGSKDRLLAEVFHRLRLDDIVRFRQTSTTARELALQLWDYYTADGNELRVFMFFELVSTACQQTEEFVDFLDSLDSWVYFMAELAQREGFRPTDAKRRARVVIAAVRGLYIDLYSGGDRKGCEEALRELLDAFFPAPSKRRT
jgi:AcrR family transcriptional regulator